MKLVENGTIVNFRKGEIIYKPEYLVSDPAIFLITDGEVEMIRHHTAIKKDSFHYSKGEMFGMLEVFTGGSRITQANAVTEVTAIGFAKSEFEKNIVADSTLAILTIRLMSRMLRELNIKIKHID